MIRAGTIGTSGETDRLDTTNTNHRGAGRRRKVMLVDKDHAVRRIIKRYLSDAGEIVDFGDGAEGARWLIRECVDLIIVDVNTPGSDAMLQDLWRRAQTHDVPLLLVECGAGSDSGIKKLGVFKVVKTVLACLTSSPPPAVVGASTLERVIDFQVASEAS